MQNFNSMTNEEYDKVLNEIALGVFTPDSETDKRQVQLMVWGLCNLLLEKGFITQEELTNATDSATTFYKLLKRRYEIQGGNSDILKDSVDSTETV